MSRRPLTVAVGGIDRDGTGAVYSFDPVGSYERESCRAAGSAQSLIQPFLDQQVRRSFSRRSVLTGAGHGAQHGLRRGRGAGRGRWLLESAARQGHGHRDRLVHQVRCLLTMGRWLTLRQCDGAAHRGRRQPRDVRDRAGRGWADDDDDPPTGTEEGLSALPFACTVARRSASCQTALRSSLTLVLCDLQRLTSARLACRAAPLAVGLAKPARWLSDGYSSACPPGSSACPSSWCAGRARRTARCRGTTGSLSSRRPFSRATPSGSAGTRAG